MRRRRRGSGAEGFSLSFLDCICCGFGAIVLLLVLTKIGEPQALEQSVEDLQAQIAKLEEELGRKLDKARAEFEREAAEEDPPVVALEEDLSEQVAALVLRQLAVAAEPPRPTKPACAAFRRRRFRCLA